MKDDSISRKKALDTVRAMCDRCDTGDVRDYRDLMIEAFEVLPSAQPFHNITMNDVLKYIDGMPEDVWQEFTACLEYRGWELQRRTAKWCGSDFA